MVSSEEVRTSVCLEALMTRIVLIGAGSVEFTRNLLGDFLSYSELHDATFAHDSDATGSPRPALAHWTASAGAAHRGRRREALRGRPWWTRSGRRCPGDQVDRRAGPPWPALR
jgi:hypothetical protein